MENKKKSKGKPKAKASALPKKPTQKKATAMAVKPNKKGKIVIIAVVAALVVACSVIGILWGTGVFAPESPGPGDGGGIQSSSVAVDFTSTLADMESTPVHELAGTYQDKASGNQHLLYKSGSIKSMFIQLLTTPELRTNLNGGGEISFSQGQVDTTRVGNGISRSVTISSEHSHGFKVGLEVGTGDKSPVQVKVSTEQTNEWTLGQSSTNEFSSYLDVEKSISTSETHTTPLSECEIGLYYAYAAYADFDVYIDVEVKLSKDTIQVVGSQACYGMSKRTSIVFVSAKNNNFNVPDDMSLDVLPIIDYVNMEDIFPEGTGTTNDPYGIYSVSQLLSVALMPHKAYRLQNNLNLQSWIWVNDIEFSGTLYGNEKTISNLSIKKEVSAYTAESYIGLFKRVTGSISDLTLSGCTITSAIEGYLVYCQMIGLFYVESVSVLANNYAAA